MANCIIRVKKEINELFKEPNLYPDIKIKRGDAIATYDSHTIAEIPCLCNYPVYGYRAIVRIKISFYIFRYYDILTLPKELSNHISNFILTKSPKELYLHMNIPIDYPFRSPTMSMGYCNLHPNDPSYSIVKSVINCRNKHVDSWSPAMTLQKYIMLIMATINDEITKGRS
tara:strand:+ start:137 stop:649 length:513 start_codon:yes stop_codon:yes gene_type:complete